MNAADLEMLAEKMGGARKSADGSWMVRCPEHDDDKPSCHLSLDGDKLLARCFAGCNQDDVFAAVVQVIDETFPKPTLRVCIDEYAYRDESGTLQFSVKRYLQKDAKGKLDKDFRPFRPDGVSTMEGVRRVVYNLPTIAAEPGRTLHWCEGEKDANALIRLGLLATTTAGGSGAIGKYDPEHLKSVARDRILIIHQDNDAAGAKYARQVAKIATSTAKSVRIVLLPDLPPAGDVSDWVASGGTRERLIELAKEAPVWTPEAEKISDPLKKEVWSERKLAFKTARAIVSTEPYDIRWIVRPWVPHRALVGVDGKPKVGKTHFLMAMIKAKLDGVDFLGEPTEAGPVVYLTEQHGASLTAALKRAGLADRDDLHVLTWHHATGIPWPAIVEAATDHAASVGALLLVIDTLPQWSGLRGDAENSAGAALEAMEPLQLATARGIAVVMLRHERKGGGDVGESARGSSAFSGAVDVVVAIRRAEGNTRPTLRVLESLSRFDETPAELVIEWNGETYVNHGTQEAVALSEARANILNAAPTTEADAITEADLFTAAGVTRSTGRRVLDAYLEDKTLVRVGKGRSGSPYKYWEPSRSDQTQGKRSDRDQNGASQSDQTPISKTVTNGSGLSENGKGDEGAPSEFVLVAVGAEPEDEEAF